MNKIAVKEAPIEDAIAVDRTVAEFGEHYSKKEFEERYRGKEKLITVAYMNGVPAGYLVGYDAGEKSFYCWMAGVNPAFRRNGTLKALMDYMEKWALSRGYNKITVKTRNRRRAMLAYLVKYGYYFTDVTQKEEIEENRVFLEKKI